MRHSKIAEEILELMDKVDQVVDLYKINDNFGPGTGKKYKSNLYTRDEFQKLKDYDNSFESDDDDDDTFDYNLKDKSDMFDKIKGKDPAFKYSETETKRDVFED